MSRAESDASVAVAPALRQLVGTLESLGAVPLPLARYRRPPGRVARFLDRAIGKPPAGDGPSYRVTGDRAWPLTDGGDHRLDLALALSGELLLAPLRRSRGVGEGGPGDHLLGHEAGTQFLACPYSAMSRAYCSVLPDGSARVIVEIASWGGPDRGEYLLGDLIAATVRAYTSNPGWYRAGFA
ncbi:hypothetical protein, partial [Krasilnikovia sp. MM14-A1259]|uniref:hypothetical protein n=1 Tax=Krasilnikovia sp. MM14-A1259 TaxID=3373539 RepID=UPI00399C6F7F